jgi:hypothetical protein
VKTYIFARLDVQDRKRKDKYSIRGRERFTVDLELYALEAFER